MKKLLAISLAFTAIALFAQATESTDAPAKTSVSGKVTIAADRMEMELKKGAQLDGNVEVVFIPEGDTLESMRSQLPGDNVRIILNADHMTVFYPEDDASSSPDRIQATGRVRIHTPDGKSATGDQAQWDMKGTGTIVLEGNCTVVAEGRVMNSARITYHIQENRFEAARAVITIPIEGKGDKKPGLIPGLDAFSSPQKEEGK